MTFNFATVALLASLAALGQFALSVYTPALPAVARDLGAAPAAAQLTFVLFLAAFASAQLAYGPAADRVGRRPVIIAGFGIFLGGSLGCALAPNLPWLIAARMVQASGAAAGIVVSRAVTRDVFDGPDLVRAVGAVTMAFALVPGLMPVLGGIVQTAFGWRAVFWLIFATGVGLAWITYKRLPETIGPKNLDEEKGRGYRAILSEPIFLKNTAIAACVFAPMSAFLAAAPTLFQVHLGVSAAEFGLYPPLSVSGFLIAGLFIRQKADHWPPHMMIALGLGFMLMGQALMVGLPSLGLVHKYAFAGPMVITATGLGLVLPVTIATALSPFAKAAGQAASLQGAIQIGGGALGAASVGLLQSSFPILALPATMLGFISLAACIHAWPGPVHR